MYWSLLDVAEVPPGVVTVMSTSPDPPAGLFAVIDVALLTVNVVAAVPPNLTVVEPITKPVPVIATEVPVGPDIGDLPVTVGSTGAAV